MDETLIISEQAPQIVGAYAHFMPDARTLALDNAWWATSEECRAAMMRVLGFEQVRLLRVDQLAVAGRFRTVQRAGFRRVHPARADA